MYYNQGRYDSIFALFSPEMKTALPSEQTVDFLTDLKNQSGNMVKREFVKYDKGTYASYKTKFENSLFAVNISVDSKGLINGLFVTPYQEEQPAKERNSIKLILPFQGEWTVIWGGDTQEQNYHVSNKAQKNAFDILVTDEKGRSYKTNGETNEDYYAFGQELFAPCDAKVVLVVDGVPDNKPGEMNPVYVPGNTVILQTAKDEFLLFAHFKQHSIRVTEGQSVKQGEVLGLCGNSGNSSEPHLHFHIQNAINMYAATGIKCYFSNILVNGMLQSEYSPVQKEKIRNQ
jgi:murein DD-endopeptidase MepM/ murein hydrolase activator NlpD